MNQKKKKCSRMGNALSSDYYSGGMLSGSIGNI